MSWSSYFRRMACAASLLTLTVPALADLAVNATRVVYAEGDFNHSLMLANTGETALLVQTWVDSGEADVESQAPFVALPAVLQLGSEAKKALQIVYNGEPLPHDKESVYWINLYQIPALEKNSPAAQAEARLDVALNLQLKVFFRPKALLDSPYIDLTALTDALHFSVHSTSEGAVIRVVNPTPFHVSFAYLGLRRRGQELPAEKAMDMMLAPFSQRDYLLETKEWMAQADNDVVVFSVIGDAGQQQEYALVLDLAAP